MRVAARAAAIAAGITAVAALAACSSSGGSTGPGGGTGGTSQTITASSTTAGGNYGSGGNYFFSPNPDTAALNVAVTFNIGSVPHDIHFMSGPNGAVLPDSIRFGANQSLQRTFTTAGTYIIHCTYHNFSGTVVIQ
jgi:plastocyanin